MRLTTLAGMLLLATMTNVAAEPRARVRATTPVLEDLMVRGRDRSATFRQLVDRLEAAEWLVLIQPGRCPGRVVVGCLLHFVGSFEGRRYLRLLVRPEGRHPDQVIGTLAHELQHAVEVVWDGGVTDGPSMMALTRRLATSRFTASGAAVFETAEARRVEETVLRELLQPDARRR